MLPDATLSIGPSLCSVTDGRHFLSDIIPYFNEKERSGVCFLKYDKKTEIISSYSYDKCCKEIVLNL